jgi:4-amino-4-deoxy-L-arabinose transferase-like glycosyltransferase
MYHLEIPRQFLAQGKIYFIPEMFRSAYPLLGEMLFLIGLAFKADAFAKLINLTFAIVFVLSAYVFGKRFLGRETALIALGILLGTPAIPTWATWVSIDFAWAAYEFWSLYILILWVENNQKNSEQYLVLAGILSGVAVSTKYLSLFTVLILSAIIVWQSLRRFPRSTANTLRNLLIFGASTTLVMFPWYIKNWFLTGNPIYPLIWGGIGWDKLNVQVFNDYHHSFGVGKNWLDYLLIPYNVYFQHERFSTFFLESIHPAIWLSFVYILLKGRNQGLVLFFYSAAYYIVWVFNSQVIRFLLPSFATLSLLAGFVIHRSPSFIKKVLTSGLLGSLLLVSLVYQILLFRDYSAYLIGQKSPSEILMAAVENYQTIQYIKETFQPNECAQFLWDGCGYYCDSRCIPDNNQNLAIILGTNSPNPQTLAHELGVKGITALLINKTDAKWFIDYHDPNRRHRQAFDYFYNTFIPACGDLIYVNNDIELYKISCP